MQYTVFKKNKALHYLIISFLPEWPIFKFLLLIN